MEYNIDKIKEEIASSENTKILAKAKELGIDIEKFKVGEEKKETTPKKSKGESEKDGEKSKSSTDEDNNANMMKEFANAISTALKEVTKGNDKKTEEEVKISL